MHEKIQRFSLRKLSVGLASVMVGACIFSVNGKTVKADVTSDQTTQTTKVQGQTATAQAQSNDVQSEKKQTSSAPNSVTGQPQKNLLDDLGKQKASTQSGDQAEAKNQENRLVDQINYKLTDNSSTDPKEDLGQNKVAPDETKQAPTDKNDAEKSIVGSSSAQKINNQSNNHADDNSQTQLNITKNSQQFTKKELATNLTQDNSSQDISKITDPSKIDTSHFADGTHWTTAGWTRTDKNTKIAQKSSITIPTNSGYVIDTGNYDQVPVTELNFTLNKNDVKKGNKILLASIQHTPTNAKQDISSLNTQPIFSTDILSNLNISENISGQQIGTITASNLDNGEIDFWFNVTSTQNLVKDPSFNVKLNNQFFTTNRNNSNYSEYYSAKNNLQYPLHYSVISNSKIINYSIAKPDAPFVFGPNNLKYHNNSNFFDTNWNHIFYYYTDNSMQINTDPNMTIGGGFVYKITTLNGIKPSIIDGEFTASAQLINVDNNLINSGVRIYDNWMSATVKDPNLSALDLWNSTLNNQFTTSLQKDGSLLVCFKPPKKISTDVNYIKDQISLGSYANIIDPQHYQQIINNASKIKNPSGYRFGFGLNTLAKDSTYQITDLTPKGINFSSFETTTMQDASSDQSSSDVETYKNVKISYIDDDDNSKSVSSDSMTGLQNKASIYTVNIPKGYYLDDNNTSTGYTWNADHTAITYTFNKDQAKNDANPIEIHLKHKHTAVTDSSQLQTTGKRTITITLPHQNKPMIIIQTVGYKRTGDLDEATNTPTYTDWVFDADTSNVTVDGQPSTQYQAYVLKDGVVNYAPIKLPHVNGYKAKLIQDKANPAMFLVSFVAVPQQNNQSTSNNTSDNVQSSQKNTQAEQNQPEPIQNTPAPVERDKEVAQILNHIAFTLMHNDSSDTADDFEPAQNDSAPLEAPSDSTQKDDAAKPQKVNAAKHKKHIVKKRVVKHHKKHAKKYHLKRRSRKHTKRAKKRIIKHRKSVSRKFRKHNLKHVKKN